VFRRVRLLIIAIGCLVACPVLLYRYYAGMPEFAELSKVSGEVRLKMESRRARRSTSTYPVLTFLETPGTYHYLDWFPRAEQIPTLVRPGNQITIWTDAGRNNWVWQIEKDNQLIVSYQEVRDAVESNERYTIIGVPVLLAIGVFASVMVYRDFRNPTA
jgi:hypothetical protein